MRQAVRHRIPGSPPGEYDIAPVRAVQHAHVEITDYDAQTLTAQSNDSDLLDAPPATGVRWIHVVGTPSMEILEKLRKLYALEPLALEDVVNLGQRPKFTEYATMLFVTLLIPDPTAPGGFEQLSVFANAHTVISFHDGTPGLLDPIRKRLTADGSRMRKNDGCYLLYALIDLAIDHLFPVIDALGGEITALEAEVLERPRRNVLPRLHEIRNRLLVYRRTAWATREILSDLFRHLDASDEDRTYLRPYLQDCHDHIVSVIDLLETHREVATSLVEVYLSLVNNRLNETMRVLTLIATLFIPPTFIVGVYGMNFDRNAGPWSMPELGWPYGYVGVMTFMAVMMIGMLVYFRRKHWI
ncbi:MAG TPA: magnesium/cobalt transporter CorA [Pseudomonadales bacterium]|nr:magnesium/cobalt transporter CorA [Pseudomonadales bacterium]